MTLATHDLSESWFPPSEMQLWNIDKQGRIETPLDSNGMVDLDALVHLGKITVTTGYDWTSPLNDVHHLQWPAVRYSEENIGSEIGRIFRDLVGRKTFIPRRFHNWIHHITVEPPVPSSEVMHHSVVAERTARNIAMTAQLALRLTRMPRIPEAKLVQRLEEEFDNYSLYVENAREVPEEFQLLTLAEVEARDVGEMLGLGKHLGKLALGHIPTRERILRGL